MIYIQLIEMDSHPVFELLARCLFHAIKDKYDCCLVPNDIPKYSEGDILILNGTFWKKMITANTANNVSKNVRIILINTEPLIVHSSQLNAFNNACRLTIHDVHILDYQSKNIEIFDKINRNKQLKMIYLPFGASSYMNKLYDSVKYNPSCKKDIDILFFGIFNERRKNIIEQLSKKYNVVWFDHYHKPFLNYSELTSYIKRSKIVLNIYGYANNKVFDYYRLSYLITNGVFLITEAPDNINLEIEYNLADYDKYLITGKYDDLVRLVDKYMNVSEDERKKIAMQTKQWFAKYNFDSEIINLLQTSFTDLKGKKREKEGKIRIIDGLGQYKNTFEMRFTLNCDNNTFTIVSPMGHYGHHGHFVLDCLIPLYIKLRHFGLNLDSNSSNYNIFIYNPLNPRFEPPHKNIEVIRRLFSPNIFYYNIDIKSNNFVNINVRQKYITDIIDDFVKRNWITDDEYWLYNYDEDCQQIIKYMRDELARDGGARYNQIYKYDKTDTNIISLRKYMYKIYNINAEISKKEIIISLNRTRKILNLNQMVDKIADLGFEPKIVDFQDMDFEEQLRIVSTAKIMIGTPGGSLTNSLFMQSDKESTYVIELWAPDCKMFYKRYFVHDSAILAAGNVLIECDKMSYDYRDIYRHSNRLFEPANYFEKTHNIITLKDEYRNVEKIFEFPNAVMHNLVNIDMYVDLDWLEHHLTNSLIYE